MALAGHRRRPMQQAPRHAGRFCPKMPRFLVEVRSRYRQFTETKWNSLAAHAGKETHGLDQESARARLYSSFIRLKERQSDRVQHGRSRN